MSFLPFEPAMSKWMLSYEEILEGEAFTKVAVGCASIVLLAFLVGRVFGPKSVKAGNERNVMEEGEKEEMDNTENTFRHDIKVSKLLLHPIKVRASGFSSPHEADLNIHFIFSPPIPYHRFFAIHQSCRGTSIQSSRYTPEGLEASSCFLILCGRY